MRWLSVLLVVLGCCAKSLAAPCSGYLLKVDLVIPAGTPGLYLRFCDASGNELSGGVWTRNYQYAGECYSGPAAGGCGAYYWTSLSTGWNGQSLVITGTAPVGTTQIRARATSNSGSCAFSVGDFLVPYSPGGTYTATWNSAATTLVSFDGGGPPPPYKIRVGLANRTASTHLYDLADWTGSVWEFGEGVEWPSGRIAIIHADEVATSGLRYKFGVGRIEGGDFLPLATFQESDWEQTSGTPAIKWVTDNGGAITTATNVPVFAPSTSVQDTNSAVNRSISFATGTNSAKDETLQTGFSSVRNAVTDAASASTQSGDKIVVAVDGAKGAVNSLAGQLEGFTDGVADGRAATGGGYTNSAFLAGGLAGTELGGGASAVGNFGSNVLSHFSGLTTGSTTFGTFGVGNGQTANLSINAIVASNAELGSALSWARCIVGMLLVCFAAFVVWDYVASEWAILASTSQMKAPHLATPGAWLAFVSVYALALSLVFAVFYAAAGTVTDAVLTQGYICGQPIPDAFRWMVQQCDAVVPVDLALSIAITVITAKYVLQTAGFVATATIKSLLA